MPLRSVSTIPVIATSCSDLVEDYARSWDLDGIMWGSERQGAFANALGAQHGGRSNDPGTSPASANSARRKARSAASTSDRAQEGFVDLEKFVRAGRAGKRPVDGYYVELWRLMLRYPELLAWENLWHDSLRETYTAIYDKVKSVKPDMGVGWHIWHNNSFSPIYRAEQDLQSHGPYSDFLKIVMYNNCAGERLAAYIESVGETVFGDVPHQDFSTSTTTCWATRTKALAADSRTPASRLTTYCARPNVPRGTHGREDQAVARHRYRHPNRCRP